MAVFAALLSRIELLPPISVHDQAVDDGVVHDEGRQQNGSPPGVPVPFVDRGKLQQELSTRPKSEEKQPASDDDYDWPDIDWLNIITAGLAAWLVWLTRGQLRAMEESNAETQKSNELSHRPWLIPMTITDIESAGPGFGGYPTIKLLETFKNTGRTPAVITHTVVSIAVFPPGHREKMVRLHDNIPSEPGDAICPPDGDFLLPVTVHLPSDEALGMILSSQLTFLIYGRVDYRDVFGKSRFTRWGMEFGHGFGAKWAEPGWISAGGDYHEVA